MSMTLSRYVLSETVSIPGPTLPRSGLFVHASKNNYSATSIAYSVYCSPISDSSSKADSDGEPDRPYPAHATTADTAKPPTLSAAGLAEAPAHALTTTAPPAASTFRPRVTPPVHPAGATVDEGPVLTPGAPAVTSKLRQQAVPEAVDRQCPEWFANTISGTTLVNMSQAGRFKVALVAKDSNGQQTQVKAWNFTVLPRATSNSNNGPHGKGCENNGTAVAGEDIFTSAFTCNCVGTGFSGPNCATVIKEARIGVLIAVASAATLLIVAGVALAIKYKSNSKKNAPFAFMPLVQSLRDTEIIALDDVHGASSSSGNSSNSSSSSSTVGAGDTPAHALVAETFSDDDDSLLDFSSGSMGSSWQDQRRNRRRRHGAGDASYQLLPRNVSTGAVMRIPEEIHAKQLTMTKEKLGNGVGGDVFRGELRSGGGPVGKLWWGIGGASPTAPPKAIPCAVKMAASYDNDDRRVRQVLLQEAALMAQFMHVNVLRLYGVVTRNQKCWLVMELCQLGSLKSLLEDDALIGPGEHNISQGIVLEIAQGIAAGMAYLSTHRFVHRDLAVRNVLVDERHAFKIGDFGLSRLVADNTAYYYVSQDGHDPFPLRWSAPEVDVSAKFTTASDVWSFAIMLYEVITRAAQQPFPTRTHDWIQTFFRDGSQRTDDGAFIKTTMQTEFPLPFLAIKDLYTDIILPCWQLNPRLRPKFSELEAVAAGLRRRLGNAGRSWNARSSGGSGSSSGGSGSWNGGGSGSWNGGCGSSSGSGSGDQRLRLAYLEPRFRDSGGTNSSNSGGSGGTNSSNSGGSGSWNGGSNSGGSGGGSGDQQLHSAYLEPRFRQQMSNSDQDGRQHAQQQQHARDESREQQGSALSERRL